MNKTIQALMKTVKRVGGGECRPASAEDLKRAKEAGFPSELIDFYRQCEPNGVIQLQQRIWSIENALVENTGVVPGCALSPHGFIVFASTICGDSYCIDTNVKTAEGQHPVVLFSHEVIGEDASLPDILPLRLEVAKSFEEFLVKFKDETLIDEPLFG